MTVDASGTDPREPPLVSVVMPVYNAQATMRRSIESVLEQSHRNVELILVNDGSKDGSPAIMDDYAARDPRVVAIHQANGGVAAARNRGLQAARGSHVAFLDSDDWWTPDKLALQLDHMQRTGAGLLHRLPARRRRRHAADRRGAAAARRLCRHAAQQSHRQPDRHLRAFAG